jgi:hypothetical protein
VVGLEPDVAALAAVAAVGTALGDVGLTAKTYATRAAVSGFGVQLRAVDEGGHSPILRPGLLGPSLGNEFVDGRVEDELVTRHVVLGCRGTHKSHVVKGRE